MSGILLVNKKAVNGVLKRPEAVKRCHLFNNGELFDIAYSGFPGDSNFYVKESKKGRILYLGTGTGRIFNSILKTNPDIVGVDNSINMIRTLRKKIGNPQNAQLIHSNVFDVKLPRDHFDKVVAPFAFLSIFPPEKVPLLLKRIRNWLKPGGVFITDIFSPFENPPFLEASEIEREETKNGYTFKIIINYDHFNQRLTEFTLFDRGLEQFVCDMTLHFYYPNELRRFFIESGFEKIQMWGDYYPCLPSVASSFFVYRTRKPKSSNI